MTARISLTLILLFWLAVGSYAKSISAEPAASGDLRWRRLTVPISFSISLRKASQAMRADADVEGAVNRSLESWEAAANIDFVVSWTDKTTLSPSGASGDGVSLVTIAPAPENLLFFGGDAADAAGRTRVFYNRRGEITEADIVLNPYQQFSTDGSFGTFDLESTLTHEIGHLLGLPHSDATGSTMNALQARNGLFNAPAVGFRSLASDDIARIRSLYGARDDADCCGSIEGKLSVGPSRGLRNAQVWAEFAENGGVAAQTQSGTDGSFALRGLSAGRYRLFVEDTNNAGIELGSVDVTRGRSTPVIRRFPLSSKPFDIQLAGLGGQLSRIALPVAAGKTLFVYVGGRGLDAGQLEVASTSSFISVGAISNRSDFGKDLDVLAIEINVSSDIPAGDYTLVLRSPDGRSSYLPGRLAVDRAALSEVSGMPE